MLTHGQGTIEYLLIIGVLIVIALITVSVLSGMMGAGGGIDETTSQTYWKSQLLSVTDIAVDPQGDGKLVITNKDASPLTVTGVTINGEETLVDTLLFQGEKTSIELTGLAPCNRDKQAYTLVITYKTKHGIIKKIVGEIPLVTKCTTEIAIAGYFTLQNGIDYNSEATTGITELNSTYYVTDTNETGSWPLDDFTQGTTENTTATTEQLTLEVDNS
jgi:hypothetical protein